MIATKESIAICAILPCVLTLSLAIQLDEANAQETIQKAPIPTEIIPELSQIGEPSTIIAAPTIDEWLEIKKDASAVEVTNILGMAGWDEDVATAGFDTSSPGDTFSLYTRNIAAGVSDFLVIPETSGQAHPLEFKSAASAGIVQTAWLPRSGSIPTANQIRDEIIAGMQAAIDSLCGMRARPSEIKVKASAVGIIEIEATWVSAEVCISP